MSRSGGLLDDRSSRPRGATLSISTPTRRRSVSRRAAPRPQAAARASAVEFDREYSLAHCEGFRVDAAEGRIGFVEEGLSMPAMAGLASSPNKPIALRLLSLGTLAVFAAWLAGACYALAYLISH